MQSAKKTGGKKEKDSNKENKKLKYEWRRIDYFFELFDEEGGTEELWRLLKLALTNDDESADARDHSNMIFFFEYAKELFENIYILLQKQKGKKIG